MYVLGLNAYHGDSAACILHHGRLIAAAEEERFRRVKHWAGVPSEAVRYCLEEAGINLGQVSTLAVNTDPRSALLQKLIYTIRNKPDPAYVLSRLRNMKKRQGVASRLSEALGQGFAGKIAFVEHHRAHLSSAFHASPFQDAVALSIDGFGDFASAAWGVGDGTTIRIDSRIHFPHSLGVFYQALTQFLGFPHYGDEYKVMGLAPYGRPAYIDLMRQMVKLHADGSYGLDLRFFRHHRDTSISYARLRKTLTQSYRASFRSPLVWP